MGTALRSGYWPVKLEGTVDECKKAGSRGRAEFFMAMIPFLRMREACIFLAKVQSGISASAELSPRLS